MLSLDDVFAGETRVQVIVRVFTNCGRENEELQRLTLRLDTSKEIVDVGVVTFGDVPVASTATA